MESTKLDAHGSKSTKTCRRCKKDLPLDAYYKSTAGTRDGLRHECKRCWNDSSLEYYRENKERIGPVRRAYHLKIKYNMSELDYISMWEEQKGLCLICKEASDLVVDHSHETGEVRGLLCDKCNQGLGSFREDPEILQEAIKYISKKEYNN